MVGRNQNESLFEERLTQVEKRIVTNWWLVEGHVSSALRTKGVRKKLYQLAFNNQGYYDDGIIAFGYRDDSDNKLFFHVLFKFEVNAINFDINLKNEESTRNSPLCRLSTQSSVNGHNQPSQEKRIALSDYKPEDSDSPTVELYSLTSASSCSILEMSSDLFKYQRIESLRIFPQGIGRVQKCHIISKNHCLMHETYGKYEHDESNFLALSPDLHSWFDGAVPVLKVDYFSCSETVVLNNRYEVQVVVEAIDIVCASTLFPRLKEGSIAGDLGTIMFTSVHVTDPSTFKICLKWKSEDTQKKWDAYRLENLL